MEKSPRKTLLMKNFSLYLVGFLLSCSAATAAVYYASPNGTADAECTLTNPGTIQAAVDAASTNEVRTSWDECDTVILLPGTYDYLDGSKGKPYSAITGDSRTNHVVVVRDYIKIVSQSNSPDDTIIAGNRASSYARAFALNGIIHLSGVTISNFSAGEGSAIRCKDTKPLIENCILTRNYIRSDGQVGAALCYGTVKNCKFLYNGNTGSPKGHGGACYSSIVNDSYFEGNKAARSGGAGRYGSYSNCVFLSNSCTSEGGGAIRGNASSKVIDCVFQSNSSTSGKGSCLNSVPFVSNCVFRSSSGNVAVYDSTVYDSVFTNNAVTSAQNSTVINSLFINNSVEKSVAGTSNCTTTNCVYINNRTTKAASGGNTYPGGAASGGTHVNAYFERNYGRNKGGAIYNGTAISSVFVNNRCYLNIGFGSTLVDCMVTNSTTSYNGNLFDDCKFTRCDINKNIANNGVVFANSLLDNSLIVSNTTIGTSGGDIASATVFVNSTVADNTPKAGKGGLIGEVTVTNTIFHSNGAYDLANGVTAINCLYSTTNNVVTPINCIVAENPLFRGSRISPARPYSLRANSPAVNAGTMEDFTVIPDAIDFYKRKRFMGGIIDIGCAEYIPADDATRFILR